MINYNKFSNQLKELLIDFGLKISKTLSKPHIKFVSEMIFGIASSKSIHLSNISRTLKESISIKETVDRLSYNLNNLDDKVIWDNYRNSINSKLDKDTLFNLDNSDIIKPHGTKFEDLCRVHDGSSSNGKTEKGYWVTEIVALRKRSNNPISVYSNIWSSSSSGFKSANNKTFDALNNLYDSFGNVGTVVMDRGYDDSKMFNYFLDKNWNFIIRGNKNRIINYQTKKYKMEDFCDKYKGKITIKVHLKNKTVNRKCSYFKVKLNGVNKKVTMVVVYFKDGPSIFYTNREISSKKDCIKVISDYYKRWRIEEYFKFKKQQFNFENFRVRSLKRINSLNALLSMSLNVINTQCEKDTALSSVILECSKSIKKKVIFSFYRVAEGIYFLLSKLSCGIRHLFQNKNKEKQLLLFSIFDCLQNFPR